MSNVKITKSIEFNLKTSKKVITLPDMILDGHIRTHIVILFKELEDKKYGKFVPGRPGRGQCHSFVKDDCCPKKYLLVVEEKPRGRPRKTAASLVENAEKEKHISLSDNNLAAIVDGTDGLSELAELNLAKECTSEMVSSSSTGA